MAKPNEHDIGAAMMAWYAECLKEYPDGLVSQAQAATMLGVSRMAVSRLVSGGYLRAVYFPKPPGIEGMIVTEEYPMFIRLAERLGMTMGDAKKYEFPKASYVSFLDVCLLWKSGETKKKCALAWDKLLKVVFSSPAKVRVMYEESATRSRTQADQWRIEMLKKLGNQDVHG